MIESVIKTAVRRITGLDTYPLLLPDTVQEGATFQRISDPQVGDGLSGPGCRVGYRFRFMLSTGTRRCFSSTGRSGLNGRKLFMASWKVSPSSTLSAEGHTARENHASQQPHPVPAGARLHLHRSGVNAMQMDIKFPTGKSLTGCWKASTRKSG